jgi:hypothetical protein
VDLGVGWVIELAHDPASNYIFLDFFDGMLKNFVWIDPSISILDITVLELPAHYQNTPQPLYGAFCKGSDKREWLYILEERMATDVAGFHRR